MTEFNYNSECGLNSDKLRHSLFFMPFLGEEMHFYKCAFKAGVTEEDQ